MPGFQQKNHKTRENLIDERKISDNEINMSLNAIFEIE